MSVVLFSAGDVKSLVRSTVAGIGAVALLFLLPFRVYVSCDHVRDWWRLPSCPKLFLRGLAVAFLPDALFHVARSAFRARISFSSA